MTLDSSKNMGGIGAILILIGAIAYFVQTIAGGVIGLIGVILVLIALRNIGNLYSDGSIFRNAIIGVIIAIVGAVVSAGVALAAFFANMSNIKEFISMLYPNWDGQWSSLPNIAGTTPNTANLNPSDLLSLIAGIIAIIVAVLVVFWIFTIVASFFIRRSLKQVTVKSQVGMFGTAGLLLLIGAFLFIIVIGAILMWIAALLLAIAFFQLKPSQPVEQQQAYVPPPPPPTPV